MRCRRCAATDNACLFAPMPPARRSLAPRLARRCATASRLAAAPFSEQISHPSTLEHSLDRPVRKRCYQPCQHLRNLKHPIRCTKQEMEEASNLPPSSPCSSCRSLSREQQVKIVACPRNHRYLTPMHSVRRHRRALAGERFTSCSATAISPHNSILCR